MVCYRNSAHSLPAAFAIPSPPPSPWQVERQVGRVSVSSRTEAAWLWSSGPSVHDPRAGCAECERFMEVADADRRAGSPWLRVLPFGRWLDRHGFGARFREDVLAPVLSCLFITKSGMWLDRVHVQHDTRCSSAAHFPPELYARHSQPHGPNSHSSALPHYFFCNPRGRFGPYKFVDTTYGAVAWSVHGGSSLPVVILQSPFLDWTSVLFTAMAWIFIPALCFAIP